MRNPTAPIVVAPFVLFASSAWAQTALPYDITMSANLGVASDYRYRGISQTNRKPTFQGGFDFAHKSGFYLGNWNSNVDSAMYNGANLEMDFYGGYKGAWSAFSYDAGLLYYDYPGSGAGGTTRIDNTELYVGGGWGPVSLKVSYAVSDFFGAQDSKGAYYLDGSVAFALTKALSLVAHLGYQGNLKNGARVTEIDGSGPHRSITDWKLGASYDAKGWLLGASVIGTDRKLSAGTAAIGRRNISGEALLLSVTRSF